MARRKNPKDDRSRLGGSEAPQAAQGPGETEAVQAESSRATDEPHISPDAGAVFSDDGRIDPELEEDLGAEYEVFVESKARVEALESELAEARRQAEENLDLARRKQAEFENFRKRMRAEQQEAVARAAERVVAELLPVLDNLERAIDHVTAGGDVKDLLKGVEMVHAQMLDVLAKEGVEVQDPFGKPFDPELHQAVQQRHDPEMPEGTVLDVFQKGYVMHGRVLRPAQVVVSTQEPPKE
ncbi:MAG: nucleotide exchange factor GrpE [Coriobacteriia bacterium]